MDCSLWFGAERLSNTRFAFLWGRSQIRAAKLFATSLDRFLI
jgi:hypothetical protein